MLNSSSKGSGAFFTGGELQCSRQPNLINKLNHNAAINYHADFYWQLYPGDRTISDYIRPDYFPGLLVWDRAAIASKLRAKSASTLKDMCGPLKGANDA